MKPKTFEALTWAAVSEFGNRKQAGRVSFVVDITTKRVFAVPREIEHKDFLCALIGRTQEEIRQNPSYALGIVPVHVDLNAQDQVYRIVTGRSGAEAFYHIKHGEEELQAAHDKTVEFVQNGEVSYVDGAFAPSYSRRA